MRSAVKVRANWLKCHNSLKTSDSFGWWFGLCTEMAWIINELQLQMKWKKNVKWERGTDNFLGARRRKSYNKIFFLSWKKVTKRAYFHEYKNKTDWLQCCFANRDAPQAAHNRCRHLCSHLRSCLLLFFTLIIGCVLFTVIAWTSCAHEFVYCISNDEKQSKIVSALNLKKCCG